MAWDLDPHGAVEPSGNDGVELLGGSKVCWHVEPEGAEDEWLVFHLADLQGIGYASEVAPK